jgi:hypothetical protein
VGVPQGKRVQITGGNLTIRGFGVIGASASNSSSGGTGSTAGTVSSGSVSIAPADDGGNVNAAAGGANGTAAGAGAASSSGQQAPLPARVALFDGSLAFTTLFIDVIVLGNFTLQRALNWTYNGTTKLYSAQIGMAGSFEMALAPVPSAAADGSGGDGTAGGDGATSSSSSVLRPTVGGSLELASSRRPGPGFTGSYDWRGSLLMTPNPFAVWAAAVAAAGASGGSVQRRRGLLQQPDPWTSSLVVPVQGPVAVNEWGAAPATGSASGGGATGSNVLIDKDGSIQLLGNDSPTTPPGDSPAPAAGGNSSIGDNSTASGAAPAAQHPKALSTRNLVIIIAASTAGLLALASCGVLAAKAAARRRRRRRDKEEAARLRLRNGQPAPNFQIPDPVAELGQPGGAAGSANGERRGSQGPAHAALPSSRGSEERRHSSSLSGSLFSSSGAKIVMLFGALGFGFHGHRGTLPGARYASTVGEDAASAQARRGGAAAGEGSMAGAARPGHARQRGSLEFRRRGSLELRWRGSLDLGGGAAVMFGNPWGDVAPLPPEAPPQAHSPIEGELLAATAGVQRRRVGGGAHQEQADWRNTSGGASDEASHDGHANPPGQFAFLTRMMAGRAAATAAAAAAAAAAQLVRHRASGVRRSAAGQGIAGVVAPFNPLFDPTPDFLAAGLGNGAWEPEEEILQLSDNGGSDRPPSTGSPPARGPSSVPRPRS